MLMGNLRTDTHVLLFHHPAAAVGMALFDDKYQLKSGWFPVTKALECDCSLREPQ